MENLITHLEHLDDDDFAKDALLSLRNKTREPQEEDNVQTVSSLGERDDISNCPLESPPVISGSGNHCEADTGLVGLCSVLTSFLATDFSARTDLPVRVAAFRLRLNADETQCLLQEVRSEFNEVTAFMDCYARAIRQSERMFATVVVNHSNNTSSENNGVPPKIALVSQLKKEIEGVKQDRCRDAGKLTLHPPIAAIIVQLSFVHSLRGPFHQAEHCAVPRVARIPHARGRESG